MAKPTKAETQAKFHKRLAFIWGVILALAVLGLILQLIGLKVSGLLWLLGVAFVSLCSIYANMGTHWGAYQAAKSEVNQQSPGVTVKKSK